MRTLPSGLAAHLASGATTLCRAWRITRADGVVQGFTDHDEPLVFDGTTFAAGTGFAGTEIEARLGLAVAGTEIHGALAAETLSEADLAAGRYDDAKVELLLVEWSEVANRLVLRVGNLGEVRRADPGGARPHGARARRRRGGRGLFREFLAAAAGVRVSIPRAPRTGPSRWLNRRVVSLGVPLFAAAQTPRSGRRHGGLWHFCTSRAVGPGE